MAVMKNNEENNKNTKKLTTNKTPPTTSTKPANTEIDEPPPPPSTTDMDVIEPSYSNEETFANTKELETPLNILRLLTEQLEDKANKYELSKQSLDWIAAADFPSNPNKIKLFTSDLEKISEFYKKLSEGNAQLYYLAYLEKVLLLIAQKKPSCSIAIIFELFPQNSIAPALENVIQKRSDVFNNEALTTIIITLSEWLRICSFCTNLHSWIIKIFENFIRDHNLFISITESIIEKLFISLIIPVCRSKVYQLTFDLLIKTKNSPKIFQKIDKRIPKVIIQLQKERYENMSSSKVKKNAEETRMIFILLIQVAANYISLYPKETINLRSELEKILINRFSRGASDKIGLVNLGNTCYMNSVLQALLLTDEFVKEILAIECQAELWSQMQKLFAQMIFSVRNQLTPIEILNIAKPNYFLNGTQQDSHEFLSHLLETLSEQETAHKKLRKSSQNIEIKNKNFNHSNSCKADSETLETETQQVVNDQDVGSLTLIEKNFGGKILTSIKCSECNSKSTNCDKFRDFQLSYPPDNEENDFTVQKLLDYYCSNEKLEGENKYHCEKCGKLTEGERFQKIIQPPKNLILILKQFKWDQIRHVRTKLMHKIFHNDKIDVKIYSEDEDNDEHFSTIYYNLYAAIIHSGHNMDSGHYYTIGCEYSVNSDIWYEFNDQCVSKCDADVLNSLKSPNTPYILFYRKSQEQNLSSSSSKSHNVNRSNDTVLNINNLSPKLREFINCDNKKFQEESDLKLNENICLHNNKFNSSRKKDDDDNNPPPPPGCGDSAFNMNMNNYIC